MALEYLRCAVFIAFASCSLPSDASIYFTSLSSDVQTIIKQHDCDIGTGSQAQWLLFAAGHVKSLSGDSVQMFRNNVCGLERDRSSGVRQNKAVNRCVTYDGAFVQPPLQWKSKMCYIFRVCASSLRYPA